MLEINEIEIPTPWGHIAAKTWGEPTNFCTIAVHGLLDNAGSFDTLIPLLPECFYYVCVDLPGHGRSSHFPPCLPVHFLNFQVAMKIIMDHLARSNYYVIAHSLGGRITLLTAQLYPEKISKLICLDSGYTLPKQPDIFADDLVEAYDTLMKVLRFKEEDTPSLTYEEAINRIMTNRIMGRLTYECSEQLARRMMKKVGEDRYIFTFDRKLRTIVYPSFSAKYTEEFLKKRPIRSDGIIVLMSETVEGISKKRYKRYMNQVKLRKYIIRGHHHSHHTDPEALAPLISNCLLKRKNKL